MLALPVNHPIRLEALADTRLLDSLPEESYDRFTRLACSILHAEVSLISLVDKDRQYFKSEYGLGEPLRTTRQNDISYSFCRYVVEGGEPFVVEDAVHDPRVNLNPAVKELGVAAYVGMPISTPDGCILGSLCAVQMVPRKWSISDLKNLSDLADAVCREVELTEQAIALQHIERVGIRRASLDGFHRGRCGTVPGFHIESSSRRRRDGGGAARTADARAATSARRSGAPAPRRSRSNQ